MRYYSFNLLTWIRQRIGIAGHRAAWIIALPFLLMLASCSAELHSPESVLNPAGPQARQVDSLTWLFIIVCGVIYVLVMLVLLGAIIHRRHGKAMEPGDDPLEPTNADEQRVWKPVFGAIAVTVIILFVFLIADFATGRSLHKASDASDPLKIKIVAHQWWWEVTYLDWPDQFGERSASNIVTTANEIHIPVDPAHPITVEFLLESHDVIHSFWVPALSGKKDIIPGHSTTLWLQVDQPATYWGECAEYCGYQHANMRLVVVAEPVDHFQTWLANQRQDAPEPTDEMPKRGKQVFLNSSCVFCHSIGGTDARGLVGPNLTHVFSRKIIAAGALQNSPGALAGWVSDPQSIKPGTQMPRNNLDAVDLRALLQYLETLK